MFVWDVLERKVVRRMKAQSPQFDYDAHKHQIKSYTGNIINNFAISPFGTYMIAIVDHKLVCKKYLLGGVIDEFIPLLKGCFF